jgi:Tfp pilus assembly protein PilO
MTKKKAKEKEKTGSWAKRLVISTVVALVAVQIVLANSLVGKGREIRQLTNEREQVKSDILALENEIAEASALNTVRAKAEKMGMRVGKVEFLKPLSLARAASIEETP